MPVFAPDESTDYVLHGSTFAAYVNSARGSGELCAWRLTIPPGVSGVAHRPSRDEVLLVLEGTLHVTVDDTTCDVGTGSVVYIPGGSSFRIDAGIDGGSAWVTTTAGLVATTDDGEVIRPPWAQ